MNGKFVSLELPVNIKTKIYQFTNNYDISVANINICNDNHKIVNFILYVNDDVYDIGELLPYESLERTGILLHQDEYISVFVDTDNVYTRVHGYESSPKELKEEPIVWITDSYLGQQYGKYITIQLYAERAEYYELVSGSIPSSFTLQTNGLLSGKNIRTNVGYNFTVKATNSLGQISYRQFTITLLNSPPNIDDLELVIPNKVARGSFINGHVYGATDPDGDNITYDLKLPNTVTGSKITGLIDYENFRLDFSHHIPIGTIIPITAIAIDEYGSKRFKTKNVEIIEQDLIPDDFNFIDLVDKERNIDYESNIVHITGIQTNYKFFIAVSNGFFRYGKTIQEVSNDSFKSYDFNGIETDLNGELYLQLRNKSAHDFELITSMNVTVGTMTKPWQIKTRKADFTPDDFNIPFLYDKELYTEYDSDEVTITGLEPDYTISISCDNGQISVNNQQYDNSFNIKTDSNGTLKLKCKLYSANDYYTDRIMNVTVGLVTKPFTIRTRKLKDVPINFDIPDKYNQERSSLIYSDIVLLTGLEPNYDFTFTIVSGDGELNLSPASTPMNSDYGKKKTIRTNTDGQLQLSVRLKSSGSWETNVDTIVQIDSDKGMSSLQSRQATYTVGTRKMKNSSTGFMFTPKNDVPLSSDHISDNVVKLSGYEPNYSYIIRCNDMKITGSSNPSDNKITNISVGTAITNNWYNPVTTVSTNSAGEMWLRGFITSSSSMYTYTNGVCVVENSAIGTFDVRTIPDTISDYFDFIDVNDAEINTFIVSNAVKVTGLSPNVNVDISVYGDVSIKYEYSNSPFNNTFYSSTDKPMTDSTGSFYLRLGVQSSSVFDNRKILYVKIGNSGVVDWAVKTRKQRTMPDMFTINSVTIACDDVRGTVSSNIVYISGLDVSTSFNISNGVLSKNGGIGTSSGTVSNGDMVTIIGNAPIKSFSNQTLTTVQYNIGGITGLFNIYREQCINTPSPTPSPNPCTTIREIPNQPIIAIGIPDATLRQKAFTDPYNTVMPIGSVVGYRRTIYTGLNAVTSSGNSKNYLQSSTYGNVWGSGCPNVKDTSSNPCALMASEYINLMETWKTSTSNTSYVTVLEGEIAAGNIQVSPANLDDFKKKNYRVKPGTAIIKSDINSALTCYWLEATLIYNDCP